MSDRLASVIYRWRFPLSAFIVLGALVFSPRANITHIDNDITAWFSRDDPVYRDYERFRDEFGGSRALIIALQADSPDRLFSRATLDSRAGHRRHRARRHRPAGPSLATATVVRALPVPPRAVGAPPPRRHVADDGGFDVRPLLDNLEIARSGRHRRLRARRTI